MLGGAISPGNPASMTFDSHQDTLEQPRIYMTWPVPSAPPVTEVDEFDQQLSQASSIFSSFHHIFSVKSSFQGERQRRAAAAAAQGGGQEHKIFYGAKVKGRWRKGPAAILQGGGERPLGDLEPSPVEAAGRPGDESSLSSVVSARGEQPAGKPLAERSTRIYQVGQGGQG